MATSGGRRESRRMALGRRESRRMALPSLPLDRLRALATSGTQEGEGQGWGL